MIAQGLNIDDALLSEHELKEIKKLLSICHGELVDIEDLWAMMDRAWEDLNCNQESLSEEVLTRYYNHPVWILNGIFSEQDEASQENRRKIVDWVMFHENEIFSVLDYGGGMGSLARALATASKSLNIDVYEPSPHAIAKEMIRSYDTIQYVNALDESYDCIICLDVMEHLTDPLNVLSKLVEATKLNGYLIFGNCFFPVIQCHLPETFYLRYTFEIFARMMGLSPVSNLHRRYINVFQKKHDRLADWPRIRFIEAISKKLYPSLNNVHMTYRKLKLD